MTDFVCAEGTRRSSLGLCSKHKNIPHCASAFFCFYLNPQVMAQILKDMGITEYEPRVINQMLEFAFRKFLFN